MEVMQEAGGPERILTECRCTTFRAYVGVVGATQCRTFLAMLVNATSQARVQAFQPYLVDPHI